MKRELQRKLVKEIADYARAGHITLLCSCKYPNTCHRSLLKTLVEAELGLCQLSESGVRDPQIQSSSDRLHQVPTRNNSEDPVTLSYDQPSDLILRHLLHRISRGGRGVDCYYPLVGDHGLGDCFKLPFLPRNGSNRAHCDNSL